MADFFIRIRTSAYFLYASTVFKYMIPVYVFLYELSWRVGLCLGCQPRSVMPQSLYDRVSVVIKIMEQAIALG